MATLVELLALVSARIEKGEGCIGPIVEDWIRREGEVPRGYGTMLIALAHGILLESEWAGGGEREYQALRFILEGAAKGKEEAVWLQALLKAAFTLGRWSAVMVGEMERGELERKVERGQEAMEDYYLREEGGR